MSIDLYCGCGRALHDYRERVTGECSRCQAPSQPHATAAAQAVEPAPAEPEESTDPVTRRLIDDALKTHGRTECPKCWNPGRFIRMALVCPKHGMFAGT